MEQDHVEGKFLDDYEAWIVHDQTIFIWLLSPIFESLLPSVLTSKHDFEVWSRIHEYFNAHLKARVQ